MSCCCRKKIASPGCNVHSYCSKYRFLVHAMNIYGRVEMQPHSFLTLTLDDHEKLRFSLRSFYPQENNPSYPQRIRAGPSAYLGTSEAKKFSFRCLETNCHTSVLQPLSQPHLIMQHCLFNPLVLELDIYSLAHHLCKM